MWKYIKLTRIPNDYVTFESGTMRAWTMLIFTEVCFLLTMWFATNSCSYLLLVKIMQQLYEQQVTVCSVQRNEVFLVSIYLSISILNIMCLQLWEHWNELSLLIVARSFPFGNLCFIQKLTGMISNIIVSRAYKYDSQTGASDILILLIV